VKKITLPFLALVLGLLPAVPASAQQTATPIWNPATTPSPRNDWIERHNGFVARARDGGIDVLFVGDSITDGWRNRGKAVWAERYEPLKSANFGIGGDKTEHVLWRLQNGELEGFKPKAAVLMIGTNNTPRDSAAQIAEGVTAIVKEIRQRTPDTKILLLAIFPRAEKPDHPLRQKINAINPVIAKLHDGQHVFFLDINDKFLQPDGILPASIMPDFLHPYEEGYKIWGEAMAGKLAELLK
jgi:lysophospholipase L1-like esterase